MSTALTLQLAHTPQVQERGGPVHALSDIDALLLAWLALEGPTPRERLAALLWPGSPADTARNALRQRLFRLRRLCAAELVSGSQQLGLGPDVSHDLDTAPAVLGTLQLPPGHELADWLQTQRHRRRERQRRHLVSRLSALEQAGDGSAALPLAEALIALDPLREDAHRQLMRLLYLAGDRASALRAFDQCEQRLKHELGTRPSPETLALLASIEAAEPPPTPQRQRRLPAALQRPPRLIGRQAELQQLQHLLAMQGRALLVGEPGMGKSRLLQALCESAVPLWWSGARPGDALVPYATLGRALRVLQQALPQALAAAPVAQLAPLLPELLPALVPALVPTLVPEPGPDSSGAQSHPNLRPTLRPGAPGRDALLAALAAVLGQAFTHFSGLVLDDLHFADPATLQLLPELSASTGTGAWLLAMRAPQEGSASARMHTQLLASGPWHSVVLSPLSDAALAELIDSLQLPQVSGAALAPKLRGHSGGNPMFALETLKLAWTEGRSLDADSPACAALPHPRNLSQLIDAGLATLSPPALLLARVAAVAGPDFSIALAERVLQRGALELASAWAELEARHIVQGTAFAHDLMQEAVLSGLPEVLARHTHGQIAEWLEHRSGEPARTAAHWEAAGLPERALPALREAAARAHRALRETDRVAFLLRGVDIAEHAGRPDDAFALLTEAVRAHMHELRSTEGVPLLDRLDRLARTPEQTATGALLRAWYLTSEGQLPAAIAAGRRALDCCAALPDGSLRIKAAQRLGTALAMAGQFAEALPLLQAAAPAMQRRHRTDMADAADAAGTVGGVDAIETADLADQADQAEFNGNLAAVLDNLGRPLEAQAHHLAGIRACAVVGDPALQTTAHANYAVNLLDTGHLDDATTELGHARQLVDRCKLHGTRGAFVAMLQAQVARARGQYSEALQHCDEAEHWLSQANPQRLPVVLLHRAHILIELAQHARAQQCLQRCTASSLPPRLQSHLAGLHARLQAALQQDALPAWNAALALAPQPGWPALRWMLMIERAALLPTDTAQPLLLQVATSAQTMGLDGVVLAARLRLAQCSPDTTVALTAAEQVLATPAGIVPNGLYRGERWLGPIHALQHAGHHERARPLARAAWDWVLTCAAHLPEPQRDAFLHRQPINLALQACL